MKYLLIVYLILLGNDFIEAQELWKRIESPTTAPLSNVFFTDSVKGWAAGDSGIIIHTTNGGLNWDFQNSGVNRNIVRLTFLNEKAGWALSWSDTSAHTYIIKTIDGENWNAEIFPFHAGYMRSIYYKDSLHGWIGGDDGYLALTTDGGVNWERATIDTFKVHPILSFNFYDTLYGFAVGGQIDQIGLMWKTTDGGLTWRGGSFGSEPVRFLHFFDSLNVIALGGDPEAGVVSYFSSDAGDTWEIVPLSVLAFPLNLSFRTPSEAWVPLGFVLNLIYSIDSGRTWNEYVLPEDYTIFDLMFPDSLHGYAVGLDGVILKYTYKPTSYKEILQENLTFSLNQNYPNPFNPTTILSFVLKKQGKVNIKIYNILGKELRSIDLGVLDVGAHDYTFKAEGLSSGVYFYVISNQFESASKKMVLLR